MPCQHIPELRYEEFSKFLHDKAFRGRIPISGSIELTPRCNLKCAHCYINESLGNKDVRAKELSTAEICNVFDQLAEAGTLWLLLTGGEPLIREDFVELYTYAKKKGMLITLFSNGTTITPEIADFLAEWRPFSVEISLYGSTKETYEKVTGIPGSFKKCMRGIKLLLERKIPMELKSVIMSLNKHEVWEMKRFTRELGLSFRFDAELNMRVDGNKKPSELRLSPKEVCELDVQDVDRAKSWMEFCETFIRPPTKPEKLYVCGAGINTFHIDAFGNLTTCLLVRGKSYNLRHGTFKEGWENYIPQVIEETYGKTSPCQTCKLISLCGQCPGWAELEHKDREKPVEYLCEIAKLRADLFIKPKSNLVEERQ